MVGAFLKEGSDGFQVSATKVESEKVASTVATFLNEGCDGFQVPATKVEPKKVASTVATFLKGQLAILTRRTASSGNFGVCQGSTHQVRKGDRYGGNLFERS